MLAAVVLSAFASFPHTTLFMHGLGGTASQFEPMMGWMREHFGAATPAMHSLPLFEGSASVDTPLLTQRDVLIAYLEEHLSELNLTRGFNGANAGLPDAQT